jgi:hypothetical protein
VLGSCGITLAEMRAQVIRVVGEAPSRPPGQIPLTKHAVNVTNLAQWVTITGKPASEAASTMHGFGPRATRGPDDAGR